MLTMNLNENIKIKNSNTLHIYYFEAGLGTRTQSVTVNATGCEFDSHSRKWYQGKAQYTAVYGTL